MQMILLISSLQQRYMTLEKLEFRMQF